MARIESIEDIYYEIEMFMVLSEELNDQIMKKSDRSYHRTLTKRLYASSTVAY